MKMQNKMKLIERIEIWHTEVSKHKSHTNKAWNQYYSKVWVNLPGPHYTVLSNQAITLIKSRFHQLAWSLS